MSSIVQIRKVAKSYLLYLPDCKHKGQYSPPHPSHLPHPPHPLDEALPLHTLGSQLWLPIGRHFVFHSRLPAGLLDWPIIINMLTTITTQRIHQVLGST